MDRHKETISCIIIMIPHHIKFGTWFLFYGTYRKISPTTSEYFVAVDALFLHFSATEICWWGVQQYFWICNGCQVLAVKLLYLLWSKWYSHPEGSESRRSSEGETCFTSCVSIDFIVAWGKALGPCGHIVWFAFVLVYHWWYP